jgi:hypothetical protein
MASSFTPGISAVTTMPSGPRQVLIGGNSADGTHL